MTALLGAAAALALVVVPAVAAAGAPGAPTPLVGTFQIAAGACEADITGSYFRMVLPTGNADGPFVGNGDSPCADTTYTPIAPGVDGGLVTGGYQPNPDPAFDENGNALADRITTPTPFYGVGFGTSTNEVDPQLGEPTAVPSISVDGSGLTGNLSAFSAQWNNQFFNQGGPKPDGETPGLTTAPSGTYDAATGAFVLEWRSLIQGGPFNGFTGVWHLEGTFASSSAPGTSAPPTTGSTTSTSSVSDPTSDTTAFSVPPTDTATDGVTSSTTAGDSASTSTTGGLRPTTTLDGDGEDEDEQAGGAVNSGDDDGPPMGVVVLAVLALLGAAGSLIGFLRSNPRAAT